MHVWVCAIVGAQEVGTQHLPRCSFDGDLGYQEITWTGSMHCVTTCVPLTGGQNWPGRSFFDLKKMEIQSDKILDIHYSHYGLVVLGGRTPVEEVCRFPGMCLVLMDSSSKLWDWTW